MGELSVRELPIFPLPEVVLFPQERMHSPNLFEWFQHLPYIVLPYPQDDVQNIL